MALGLATIIGAGLGLLGAIFGKVPIIAVGILIALAGFFITVGTISIPWYVWLIGILIIILLIKNKR